MELKKGTFSPFPANLCRGRHPYQQVILAWLWNHANNDGVCFPSLSYLSDECGMDRSAVQRHLRELEKDGLIERKRRVKEGSKEFASTVYTVLIPDTQQAPQEVGAENGNVGADVPYLGADSPYQVGAESPNNCTHSFELKPNNNTPYIPPRGKDQKKEKKDFAENSSEYVLASLLFSLIRDFLPAYKPEWDDARRRAAGLQEWAQGMDLILRIDGRPYREVEFLIRWAQQDNFWRANILSPRKLRKQYDQLMAQAKRQAMKSFTPHFETA